MLDLSSVDLALIIFVSLLAVYLTFKPTLHAKSICGALLLACAIVGSGVHAAAAAWVLPASADPQFLTSAVFLIAGMAVFSRLALKEARTTDRALVGAATLRVRLSAYLFHCVLVMQTLPAWANDGALGNARIIAEPLDRFLSSCREARLVCWGWETKPKVTVRLPRHRPGGLYRLADEQAADAEYSFGSIADLNSRDGAVALFRAGPKDIRLTSSPASRLARSELEGRGFLRR